MIRRALSIAALVTVVVVLLAGPGEAQGCPVSACGPGPAGPAVAVDQAGLPHEEPGDVLMTRSPRESSVTPVAAASGITLVATTLTHIAVRRRRALAASATPAMEASVAASGRRGKRVDTADDRPSPVGSTHV